MNIETVDLHTNDSRKEWAWDEIMVGCLSENCRDSDSGVSLIIANHSKDKRYDSQFGTVFLNAEEIDQLIDGLHKAKRRLERYRKFYSGA